VRSFIADLHLHTALSPCAEEEMTPPAIIAAARAKGLDMIAICDHNSAGNAAAVQAAAGAAPAVIAGIEIATSEDIHVLGLFPDAQSAEAAADTVRAGLPAAKPGGSWGGQFLLDADGRTRGTEPKMLAASSTLSLDDAIALIKAHHGLAVAAHVNRPSFSVLSQLGLFPREAGFDAVEIFHRRFSPRPGPGELEFGLPRLYSSDSHFLADVGTVVTILEMLAPTFDELKLALAAAGGRCVHA
jgi:3',5'-nucleoside bisphosphate phosphatase